MIPYTLKKIGYATLTLFGVVSVIFMLFNILPDDPAKMMLGQNQNKEQIAAVQKKYGLDKPIFTQYLLYINDLSPISYHSGNSSHYTFLAPRKYNVATTFSIGSGNFAIKLPYLRESFQKSGKKVSTVISKPCQILLSWR